MSTTQDITLILKSREEQMVEARFDGEDISHLLRRLYEDDLMTQTQIAQRLGISLRSVVRWFGKYDIVGRHPRGVARA